MVSTSTIAEFMVSPLTEAFSKRFPGSVEVSAGVAVTSGTCRIGPALAQPHRPQPAQRHRLAQKALAGRGIETDIREVEEVSDLSGYDAVVAPSGSCSGMIRTHYADLFKGDAAMSERFARLAAENGATHLELLNVPGAKERLKAHGHRLRPPAPGEAPPRRGRRRRHPGGGIPRRRPGPATTRARAGGSGGGTSR